MIKPRDPRELAIDLLPRSICSVQVAAVIADSYGIFSWGWNSMGADGLGEHAEAAAIRRANKKRLEGATIYIASRRKRNQKVVLAMPCPACWPLCNKWSLEIWFRNSDGIWRLN